MPDRRQYIGLGDEKDSKQAADHYEKLLRLFEASAGFRGLLVRTGVWWLVATLVLFLLFAFRPQAIDPLAVRLSLTDTASAPACDGALELSQGDFLYQCSFALAFRDYVARSIGLIPTACAITDLSLPVPAEGSGRVWLLDTFGIDPAGSRPCSWRDRSLSFIAAVSPDVGPVQKVTLLVLIIGLLLLKRNLIQQEIEGAAFPVSDGLDQDQIHATDKGDLPKRAQHPISWIHPNTRRDSQAQALYPMNYLPLVPLTESVSRTRNYRDRLLKIDTAMATYAGGILRAPFDLILDVLETGARSGSVGEADKRMRIAVFEYREAVVGRLWPVDYLLWLLPTIGFLGTIYGISASLVRAKGLFAGADPQNEDQFSANIQLVVDGLGVAFDTTSMALVCAAILFAYMRWTEAGTDRLVDDARRALTNLLLNRMLDRGEPTDLPPDAQAPADLAPKSPDTEGSGRFEVEGVEPKEPVKGQ